MKIFYSERPVVHQGPTLSLAIAVAKVATATRLCGSSARHRLSPPEQVSCADRLVMTAGSCFGAGPGRTLAS